ncbi:MAG: DUF362 domain-containing protein [bacterium]
MFQLFPWKTVRSRLLAGNAASTPASTPLSEIYVARNGTPEQNMKSVVAMLGGIEKIIGEKDIVILKPNAQWWHQGMTNTDAMKAFMDLILEMPGFAGEIIIAENHHHQVDDALGWTTEHRNGSFNYNELVDFYHAKGIHCVSKYHWHDAGPNPKPRQGNAGNGRLVQGAAQGDGYVWRKDLVYESPEGRKCMMTYPIFTSAYSGTTIDLKDGAWKNGKYIDTPIKFVNFSALNHHSHYCGATASVKNLMGVVDMTCGHQGPEPAGYWNTHYIGMESAIHKLGGQIRYGCNKFGLGFLAGLSHDFSVKAGTFNFQYTGGALGCWMRTIRQPDLNIITAEWVGYGSRIDTSQRAHTRTIFASKDPIALDYHAAKYCLLPATLEHSHDENLANLHNSDLHDWPFRKFLEECHRQGIGTLREADMKIHIKDFNDATPLNPLLCPNSKRPENP